MLERRGENLAGGPHPAALLMLVVGLFLLCASLWSLTVPAFESPDETGHARYVNFLRSHHRLPVADKEVAGEAHQPPLYYALAGWTAAVTGTGEIPVSPARNPSFRWYGGTQENKYIHPPSERPPLKGGVRALHRLRFLSVLLSAMTIVMIYRLGRVAGVSREVSLTASALAAFIPQFTFISAMLNNDNLVNLLSTAAMAYMVAGIRSPGRYPLWVAGGTLAGLALLTKFSALVLLPLGVLAVILARPFTLPAIPAFLVPALAVPAPLLVRNLIVMGDPLGAGAQIGTLPNLIDRKHILSSYFLIEFPSVLFRSFWGTFGWMSFHMPGIIYLLALAVTLFALAGLALHGRGPRQAHGRAVVFFGSAVVLQLAQVVVYNLTFTQAQGRFLFPVIAPITLLLALGLAEIARRTGLARAAGRWLWLVPVTLAVGNLCLLRLVLVPAYQAVAELP